MTMQGLPAARQRVRHRPTSTTSNVQIALFEKIVLVLHPQSCRRSVQFGCYPNLSLGGELFLRDGKNAAFVYVYHISPLLVSLENVTLGARIRCNLILIG